MAGNAFAYILNVLKVLRVVDVSLLYSFFPILITVFSITSCEMLVAVYCLLSSFMNK